MRAISLPWLVVMLNAGLGSSVVYAEYSRFVPIEQMGGGWRISLGLEAPFKITACSDHVKVLQGQCGDVAFELNRQAKCFQASMYVTFTRSIALKALFCRDLLDLPY